MSDRYDRIYGQLLDLALMLGGSADVSTETKATHTPAYFILPDKSASSWTGGLFVSRDGERPKPITPDLAWAAPLLLEALAKRYCRACNVRFDDPGLIAICDGCKDARAAIAAARGETP